MRRSDLPQRISRRLLGDIAAGSIQAGQHLGAQQLADRYGVFRTPIRKAMHILEANGYLIRWANRGYFVSNPDPEALSEVLDQQPASMNDAYHRLAEDWLTGRLPEEVTEQYICQAYGWTKSGTNDILVRTTLEGWVERKDGYGWRFLPVANTPEAFDAIFRFRMVIEPAAMLEPSFELNRQILTEKHRIQDGMLEMDFKALPAESLLKNGALFHEELIRLSGNPYVLMAFQRVNGIRRSLEYRAEMNHQRLVE